MTDKRVLVISRALVPGAQIAVNITVAPEEGVPTIALSISVDDFLAALVAEIGNPTLILTQAQLARRLTAAAETVVSNIKGESVRVM